MPFINFQKKTIEKITQEPWMLKQKISYLWFNVNYMDKQDLVVCFWMRFLLYLVGFGQKTKYRALGSGQVILLIFMDYCSKNRCY